MTRREVLGRNAATVEARLAEACRAAGRARSEVTVVAVTKYVTPPVVAELAELGLTTFGESRPQMLWDKAAALPHLNWHLVGHLQRNKIERTLPLARLIHSVDSQRLLEALNHEAQKKQLPCKVLLEVHLSGEESKQGLGPAELAELGEKLEVLPAVEVRGLMTMAALDSNAATARQTFARLRELRDKLRREWPHGERLTELSMGMTNDFPEAVAEGATLVRIGSAFFEGLPPEEPC